LPERETSANLRELAMTQSERDVLITRLNNAYALESQAVDLTKRW